MDTFVLGWSQGQAASSLTAFRNGQHPNLHASDAAWAQYDRQAEGQGFTDVAGEYAGHTLWGRADGYVATFANRAGVDTLVNFDPVGGDRIHIAGISDLGAWEQHVQASAVSGGYDLSYDGAVFAHVTTGAAFSMDWFAG